MQLFCTPGCLAAYERALFPPLFYSLDPHKEIALWQQVGGAHWTWITGPMRYNYGYQKRKFITAT